MQKFRYFWLPLLCLGLAICEIFHQLPIAHKEQSGVENLTILFLLIPIAMLLVFAAKNFRFMTPLDRFVLIVLVLGSVYFCGEEMSWGQHLFGFETPLSYSGKNHQQETNLHNLENPILHKLFDKIPRFLVVVGIFFSGIILPFCREWLPRWLSNYVPGKEILLTSILAVTVTWPSKLLFWLQKSHPDVPTIPRSFDPGEVKEMYIALFIMLFSISFMYFIKHSKSRENTRAGNSLAER